MIQGGLKHLANGANAVEIKRGIDKAVKCCTLFKN
jgi:chaperonin GroEL (HSP60 family)